MPNPHGVNGKKPRRRVVYLTDLCTCDHERKEHVLNAFGERGMPAVAPPNFGRYNCTHPGCECPLFVKQQREFRQKRPPGLPRVLTLAQRKRAVDNRRALRAKHRVSE